MSLYPQTGQKKVSPQPPSPTQQRKKSPLFPPLRRRFSRAKSVHRRVKDSIVRDSVASSCSSSDRSSSLSDADHDHGGNSVAGKGLGEPHSPLRSGISPQTQASMDNVFRWGEERVAEGVSECSVMNCCLHVYRFDAEHSEDEISKAWPHRCCYVVKELLVTERVYVQALGRSLRCVCVCVVFSEYAHFLE